jgi:excisionase family DNA binding protein
MTTSYNAIIEFDLPMEPTRAERLLDEMAAYHPATGRSLTGNLELTITMPGEDLGQVMRTTAALLAELDLPAIRLEVMPTVEFDRRSWVQPVPELLSVTDAAKSLGVSRQAVLQRIEGGRLEASRIGNSWAIPKSVIERDFIDILRAPAEIKPLEDVSIAALIDVNEKSRAKRAAKAKKTRTPR